MNFDPNLWFPPANILYHGNRRLNELHETPAHQERKLILESMSTAIMVIGIARNSCENFWVQLVNPDIERTPDVRTMRLIRHLGQPNELNIQEIEVVTYEAHSSEELSDFLIRTKLSGHAYPETTTILCHIDRNIQMTQTLNEVHELLQACTSRNDVMVLARLDPINHVYRLVKVHPTLEVICNNYDIFGELFSRPRQRVMRLFRGTDSEITSTTEQHLPF